MVVATRRPSGTGEASRAPTEDSGSLGEFRFTY
jgi:hypothetical protein